MANTPPAPPPANPIIQGERVYLRPSERSDICDFGFGELRLERIWLDVYAPNLRAQRSYEKAGFLREGTMRRALFKRGEYADVHRMSLLRSEWRAMPRRAGVGTSG